MKNHKTKLVLTILLTGMMFVLLTFASQASSAGDSLWLKDEMGCTSDWYTPDDSDGTVPDGSVIRVTWWNGEDGAQPDGAAADPWASGSLNIKDATLFPDEGMRQMLDMLDADKDGDVDREEAKAFFEKTGGRLELQELRIAIRDYAGIETLGEYIKILTCSYANGASVRLNVSGLPLLEQLYCCDNPLEEGLDVSGNPLLHTLSLRGSKIAEIDLSQNPALERLHVGETGLTAIDLSANPELYYLVVSGNELTQLDLSGNPLLTKLYCHDNPLTTIDLANNPELTYLSVWGCGSATTDISACPLLVDAYLNGYTYTSDVEGKITKATARAVIVYSPGQTILTDSALVRFAAGEAGGAVSAVLVRHGEELVLPECGFEPPEGKRFAGWQADGGIYDPGDKVSPSEKMTFAALWEDIPSEDGTDGTGGGSLCKWCGERHAGILGMIVGCFHRVFYFFARLFGQR